MDLYVLRHGKAEERSVNIRGDAKRKLTESGIKEMVHISNCLGLLDLRLDYLVSSPLRRAKQTADIAAKTLLSKKKSVTVWNELKPEIDVEKTIQKLKSLKPNSSVMLVGHEPHLSTLIASLISTVPDGVDISLKKGGFAHVRISSTTQSPSGGLRSILTPRQMKKLCN